MADASYRFHAGAGQYFFPQRNQQSLPQRQVHHRNGSPITNTRIFPNDTPSPTRSPRQLSPTSHQFTMYNQSHQQGQGVFMNGGHGHQRYGMQVGSGSKSYQNHANHGQHRSQQDHLGNGHTNFSSHQHNSSTSGFPSSAHQFNAHPLRNGTPTHLPNGPNRKPNEQWEKQLSLAQTAREATGTHSHARNQPANKAMSTQATETARKDGEREDRNRASNFDGIDTAVRGWNKLDLGGQGLRALSSPLFFSYSFLKELFLNNNKLAALPPSIGRLRTLTLLDVSLNDLTELPAELGMLVNLRTLLLFDNHLETLPYELGFLYQLDMLGIEGNPLNEDFKSIMVEEGTNALITTLREQAETPDPPMERDWILLEESTAISSKSGAEKFKVLSYNTLCDKYATQSQYGYTPRNALAWDHRRGVILDELRGHDADILCLQEIDKESYEDYFRPALAENPYGYKGAFWQKGRARTMGEKEAKLVDGCATFYKERKYILLDKQHIDFSNAALNRLDMRGETAIYNRVMPRDDIAVVTFLEDRQTGVRIMVVNAHIFWDPQFKDVKVVQVALLMEQIAKIAETYARHPPLKDKAPYAHGDADDVAPEDTEYAPSAEYASGPLIPLVLCIDSNSTPESGVYDLLSNGTLACSHSDLGNFDYGNFTKNGMTHPFSLKSAYGNMGELPFTNYTPGFTGVIDYIMYSANALSVTGLLGEVDKEYLMRVPGFPNYHFPSDHLALVAEFVVKSRKAERRVVEADFGPGYNR